MTLPDDGVYEDVPFADYLAWPAVSNTGTLKKMRRSPLYCRRTEGQHDEATPAMRVGSALNDLVLVPSLWPERFAILGDCTATKGDGSGCTNRALSTYGGVQLCGVHARGKTPDDDGRIYITEDAADRARAMADAIHADEDAHALLERCDRREVSILWTDKPTGLRCKGRVDLMSAPSPLGAVGADLKKSAKAHPDTFPREILTRGYHSQLAWYDAGLRALGCPVDEWSLLVVHDAKDDVHEVGVYDVIIDAIMLGAERNRATLDLYAECRRTGKWGGFGRRPMSVPSYALADDEGDEDTAAHDGAVMVP